MIYSDLNMKGDLEYQVAIYGAGPAGITLARALAAKGILVGLFEAGGESHQVLGDSHPYHGENVGRPYDMMHTRLRYLGGASNHWGGGAGRWILMILKIGIFWSFRVGQLPKMI